MVYRPPFHKGLLHPRQPREDHSEGARENQGDETKVSSHLSVVKDVASITSTDPQKTLTYKMAKRKALDPPAEN